MIKLVAFDWNGTIFADTDAVADSVNQVLKSLGKKSTTLKIFQKHYDVPVSKSYLGLGISEKELKEKAAGIAKTFHENYEKRAAKVRTRAYAKFTLDWLSKNKVTSVIFSNHIDKPIKNQLERLKINKYFDKVMANSHPESSLRGRNKMAKLAEYMKERKFKGSEILIVGDSIEEIEIGKELGCKTAAITEGNCSKKRLEAAKPDYLIASLKETIRIIQRLNAV